MPTHLPMDSLIQTLTDLNLQMVTQIPKLTDWLTLKQIPKPKDSSWPTPKPKGWLIRMQIPMETRRLTEMPIRMLIRMQTPKPTDLYWLIRMPMDLQIQTLILKLTD